MPQDLLPASTVSGIHSNPSVLVVCCRASAFEISLLRCLKMMMNLMRKKKMQSLPLSTALSFLPPMKSVLKRTARIGKSYSAAHRPPDGEDQVDGDLVLPKRCMAFNCAVCRLRVIFPMVTELFPVLPLNPEPTHQPTNPCVVCEVPTVYLSLWVTKDLHTSFTVLDQDLFTSNTQDWQQCHHQQCHHHHRLRLIALNKELHR